MTTLQKIVEIFQPLIQDIEIQLAQQPDQHDRIVVDTVVKQLDDINDAIHVVVSNSDPTELVNAMVLLDSPFKSAYHQDDYIAKVALLHKILQSVNLFGFSDVQSTIDSVDMSTARFIKAPAVTPVASSPAQSPLTSPVIPPVAAPVTQASPVVSTVASPTPTTPAIVEDLATELGIPVINGKDWVAQGSPRTAPMVITSIDYSKVNDSLGKISYLLVSPEAKDDVRVEIRSQNTSGSAGDKLPTNIFRMVNAAKTNAYARTLVGVVGLKFFAEDALHLARDVAAKSSRVQLVEGTDNFIDSLRQEFGHLQNRHDAVRPLQAVSQLTFGDDMAP